MVSERERERNAAGEGWWDQWRDRERAERNKGERDGLSEGSDKKEREREERQRETEKCRK